MHASRPHSVYIQGKAKRADQLHLHQNKHIPNDFWAKDRLSLAAQRSIFRGKITRTLISHIPENPCGDRKLRISMTRY